MIGSSDDHRGRPGRSHWGLAGVWATELTRDAIFQGLYERRTLATTGVRILLDFSVDGAEPGQVAVVEGAADIEIRALAPSAIAWIELLHLPPGGERVEVAHRWTGTGDAMTLAWSHDGFAAGSLYAVRLQLRRMVRNRVAMAFSSPVWTERASQDHSDSQ